MACANDKISNLPQNHVDMDLEQMEYQVEMLRTDGEQRKMEITDHFRTLHEDLNKRQNSLLAEIDEIVQSTSAKVASQKENLLRFRKAKQDAESIFENNQLIDILKETIDKIQSEIDSILSDPVVVPELELKWNVNQAQECVTRFCEILQLKHPYNYRRTCKWASGREGVENENIKSPFGLAIDPETDMIYVADCLNNRIQIFGYEGEYIRLIPLDAQHPRSLIIHGVHCYVTCDLWVLKLLKANGTLVSSQKLKNEIRGLDLYKEELFVCELEDYFVYVFGLDLALLKKVRLKSEFLIEDKHGLYHAYQFDIKIIDDIMYILFANASYPLQSFSMNGALIKPIISEDRIQESYFFCVDSKRNFLLTDRTSHQIKIFNREGVCLGNVGQKGLQKGQLRKPMGIAVNRANRIIVCDLKADNLLQCF